MKSFSLSSAHQSDQLLLIPAPGYPGNFELIITEPLGDEPNSTSIILSPDQAHALAKALTLMLEAHNA